jgi:hypothetical protein
LACLKRFCAANVPWCISGPVAPVRGDTFYIAFDVRSHTSFMAVSQGDCLVSNGFWLEPAGVAVRLAIEKSRGQPL